MAENTHGLKKPGKIVTRATGHLPGKMPGRETAKGLGLRSMLVTAAVTAALSLAPAPQHDLVYAGSASTKVEVSALVMVRSQMKVLRQVSQVRITQTDIKRGYVDVASASRFEIESNNPQGYVLMFHGLARPFKAVHAKGSGTDVYLDGGEGFVQRGYVRGREVVELSYRLILSEDVKPGVYAWPVNFSVQSS